MAKRFGKFGKKSPDKKAPIDETETLLQELSPQKKLEIQPAVDSLNTYLRGNYRIDKGCAQLAEYAHKIMIADPRANEELLVNTAIRLIKDYTTQKPASLGEIPFKEYASFLKLIRRVAGEIVPFLGQTSGLDIGLVPSEKALDTLSDNLQMLIATGSKETQEVTILMASVISANPRASQKALHLIVVATLQTAGNTEPEDWTMLIKLKDIAKKVGERASLNETLDIASQLRDATERLERKDSVEHEN